MSGHVVSQDRSILFYFLAAEVIFYNYFVTNSFSDSWDYTCHIYIPSQYITYIFFIVREIKSEQLFKLEYHNRKIAHTYIAISQSVILVKRVK